MRLSLTYELDRNPVCYVGFLELNIQDAAADFSS